MPAAKERWKRGQSSIELRHQDDGLDEIVARNVHFHLERLDSDVWWMALDLPRCDDRITVRLYRRGKQIEAGVDREIVGTSYEVDVED